jgi:hypothetical protein
MMNWYTFTLAWADGETLTARRLFTSLEEAVNALQKDYPNAVSITVERVLS